MAVIMYSCSKRETPSYPPVSLSVSNALDSMHIQYGVRYHVILERLYQLDSSRTLRFNIDNSVTEYHQYTDVFGDHVDSVDYGLDKYHSEYHQPNPSDYATTIGYVFLNYHPVAFTINGFPIHDLIAADSMIFRIGANTRYYAPRATFHGPRLDSPQVHMTIRSIVPNGDFFAP